MLLHACTYTTSLAYQHCHQEPLFHFRISSAFWLVRPAFIFRLTYSIKATPLQRVQSETNRQASTVKPWHSSIAMTPRVLSAVIHRPASLRSSQLTQGLPRRTLACLLPDRCIVKHSQAKHKEYILDPERQLYSTRTEKNHLSKWEKRSVDWL